MTFQFEVVFWDFTPEMYIIIMIFHNTTMSLLRATNNTIDIIVVTARSDLQKNRKIKDFRLFLLEFKYKTVKWYI